ncbi:MAG TPA: hypothetical protein VN369_03055 [Terriglobales bacterium]|nr:hypothetical protein [Terriglobales bacterium]
MNLSQNRRGALLLMELALSIFIFSVCAGICLRVFAYARSIAQDSRALSGAVLAATTAAERYRAAGGGKPVSVRYGEDWDEDETGPYRLTLSERPEGGAKIVVEGEAGVLYTLTVKAVNRGG